MKKITAPTREEAERMAEHLGEQPKVEGSLEVTVGEFKLSVKTQGADVSATAAILSAAYQASTGVNVPTLITWEPQ